METITVTRGLAELKLLDSKILKKIEETWFIDLYQKKHNKTMISRIDKDNTSKNILSNYDSIVNLMLRRNSIKASILKSNAKTIVKINDEEFTVTEAIAKKNTIQYDKKLLQKMKKDLTFAKNEIDRNNANMEEQIQSMIETSLGTDKKPDKKIYDTISKPIYEANNVNMIDPIGIEKRIKEMEDYIDNFLLEVDFVLSESNSQTYIEI